MHLSVMGLSATNQEPEINSDGYSDENRYITLSHGPDLIKSFGLATHEMSYLPVSDNKLLDYECAICLELMEDEIQVRGLPCGHVFHVTCVDKWLLYRQPSCPVCKASYNGGLDMP